MFPLIAIRRSRFPGPWGSSMPSAWPLGQQVVHTVQQVLSCLAVPDSGWSQFHEKTTCVCEDHALYKSPSPSYVHHCYRRIRSRVIVGES